MRTLQGFPDIQGISIPFVTADARRREAADGSGPEARWVGEAAGGAASLGSIPGDGGAGSAAISLWSEH